MKAAFRLSQFGAQASLSLQQQHRLQAAVKLTPDGLKALQSMPTQYQPRQHRPFTQQS